MKTILEVYFLPPLAVARLGSSEVPLESFIWAENPSVYGGDMTVIEPAITLAVNEDGSLSPYLPTSIRFRDGKSLRPVAPFFELWATVQTGEDGTVEEVPLTLSLLKEVKASLENIRYRVRAANRKAERRTGSPACSYSAMVEVQGTDHQRYPLLAYSPHQPGQPPLVYQDHPIPLGHFQVLRPRPSVEMEVDLSIVRVRFTPAQGQVYGPPGAIAGPSSPLPPGESAPAVLDAGRVHEIVRPENRILNPDTPWSTYTMGQENDDPDPSDSYDGANVGDNRSWGVIDDTCDAVIEAQVAIAGKRFVAMARVLVSPPDFAPDRRPFYSIADDLADRELPPVVVNSETEAATAAEVSDLFRRIFETVSLMNLDAIRTRAIQENDSRVPRPNFAGLPKIDQKSMTRADVPYVDKSPELLISAHPDIESKTAAHDRLPYTQVAAFVHAPLTEAEMLLDFFRSYRHHIQRLIRPAYGTFSQLDPNPAPDAVPNPHFRDPRILRDTLYDMRMPPYMRDSDEAPLSLSRRQYQELMDLVKHVNKSIDSGQTANPSSK